MFVFEKSDIHTFYIICCTFLAKQFFWSYLQRKIKKKLLCCLWIFIAQSYKIYRKISRECIEFLQTWHPSPHSKTSEQNSFLKPKYSEIFRLSSEWERDNSRTGLIRKRFYSFSLIRLYVSVDVRSCVRVVDDRRPQFEEKEGGKKKEEGREEVRERNEGTYSRRAVVIGGNFIILRHYPRYCNAIKLDTLRTPCGTGGISRALSSFADSFSLSFSLLSSSAFFLRERRNEAYPVADFFILF